MQRTKDDCLAACVASVLEVPIESVPHFCNDHGDWLRKFNGWVRRFGLGIIFLPLDRCDDPQILLEEYCRGFTIGGVTSERGMKHAVVLEDGEIVHDPFPGGNLAPDTKIEDVTVFTVNDPAIEGPLGPLHVQ